MYLYTQSVVLLHCVRNNIPRQSRSKLEKSGQAIQMALASVIVRSTISMHSMLMLGGSGGMPPRKIFEKRCSEIAFGGILSLKTVDIH